MGKCTNIGSLFESWWNRLNLRSSRLPSITLADFHPSEKAAVELSYLTPCLNFCLEHREIEVLTSNFFSLLILRLQMDPDTHCQFSTIGSCCAECVGGYPVTSELFLGKEKNMGMVSLLQDAILWVLTIFITQREYSL